MDRVVVLATVADCPSGPHESLKARSGLGALRVAKGFRAASAVPGRRPHAMTWPRTRNAIGIAGRASRAAVLQGQLRDRRRPATVPAGSRRAVRCRGECEPLVATQADLDPGTHSRVISGLIHDCGLADMIGTAAPTIASAACGGVIRHRVRAAFAASYPCTAHSSSRWRGHGVRRKLSATDPGDCVVGGSACSLKRPPPRASIRSASTVRVALGIVVNIEFVATSHCGG